MSLLLGWRRAATGFGRLRLASRSDDNREARRRCRLLPHAGVARHTKVYALAGVNRRVAKLGVLHADVEDRRAREFGLQDFVELLRIGLPRLEHAGRAHPDQLDAKLVG